MSGTRINKALAQAGVGSRREVERWIVDGRVLVNGEPAQLGQKLTARDRVTIDDEPVSINVTAASRAILYHKPVGEMSTRKDPQGRPTVFDKLPKLNAGRWISIGRLDLNTAGLMIFTTDGDLAHRLMHPSSSLEREYAVRVLGDVSPQTIRQLTTGVELDDGPARFKRVAEGGGRGANRWFRVVLTEGRKREVRRLWEAVGLKVSRLIRVRFGNVRLPRDLRPGEYRTLDTDQLEALRARAAS